MIVYKVRHHPIWVLFQAYDRLGISQKGRTFDKLVFRTHAPYGCFIFRFEPRSHFISSLSMIVRRVNVRTSANTAVCPYPSPAPTEFVVTSL